MIFEHMDRIVFAGDSVTSMESDQPVGEGLFDSLGKGYVRIIENMLSASRTLFKNYKFRHRRKHEHYLTRQI